MGTAIAHRRSQRPDPRRSELRGKSWRRGWTLIGCLGWLGFGLAACIIETREYDEQFAECWRYCESLETSCTGNSRVYEDRETCLAVCRLMEPAATDGEIESTSDTLQCRQSRLGGGIIEANECPYVGPGGNGACGSNCRALCRLRSLLCRDVAAGVDQSHDVADIEGCEADCAALYDRQDIDASAGGDVRGDTVQCRLIHVSRAALHPEQAAQHCQASQIRPTPGEREEVSPCSDPTGLDKNLECEKYCKLLTTACTEQFAVYKSFAQCRDTCLQTMEPGERGDETLDTIRCRRYHAYFSLEKPDEHCLHASATGDGHCGTENCTAYCRILEQACGDEFQQQFGATAGTVEGGQSACVAACLPVEGGNPGIARSARDNFAVPLSDRYQLNPPPTGNNLLCRAYHAVEALSDPTNHCAAAFGGGDCQ